MKAILLLALLALVSFLGSAKVLGKSRIPGLRLFSRTGILFLLLGACIGYNELDILDQETYLKLGPVIVIGLGWLGFTFGTNLEFRTLRKFPLRLYLATWLQALITFAIVFGTFTYLNSEYLHLPTAQAYIAASLLAATAAGTAPASLFMLGGERLVRGTNFETLRFFATLDDFPGLLALGVLCSFSPGLHQARYTNPIFWFFFQVLLGVVFGFFLRTLKARSLDQSAGDLMVFGVIGMSSGLCLYLHLSPLFVSAISGMVVVNISDRSEAIYQRLVRRERAFYVLFLLLSGCLWVVTPNLPVLVLAYVLSRLVGKTVGTALAVKSLPKHWPLPVTSGLGLISQGGFAIAMVVSYRWAFGAYLVDWVVGVVLSAVVIHEMAGPWIQLKMLQRMGDA